MMTRILVVVEGSGQVKKELSVIPDKNIVIDSLNLEGFMEGNFRGRKYEFVLAPKSAKGDQNIYDALTALVLYYGDWEKRLTFY